MSDPLTTVNSQLLPIFHMVGVVVMVIGLVLTAMGLHGMATAGANRGGATHGIGASFILTIAGALMVNIRGTVSAGVVSLYGAGVNPTAIMSTIPHTNPVHRTVAVIFSILVILGWIASARGLMHLGFARKGREGGFKRAVIFIVAGALLTNPYGLAQTMGLSFGQGDLVNMILPPAP